jgi:hypothetical protein
MLGHGINLRGERNNLGTGETIFPRDLGHCGEGLEKLVRRIGAADAALRAIDEEKPVPELKLGRLFNKNRGYTLTHSNTPTRGLGGPQTATNLIHVKAVVTVSPKIISRVAA